MKTMRHVSVPTVPKRRVGWVDATLPSIAASIGRSFHPAGIDITRATEGVGTLAPSLVIPPSPGLSAVSSALVAHT